MARVSRHQEVIAAHPGDFPKAWQLLLEHVEKLALSPTQEVSLAALKAFHEMVVSGEEVVEEEKEE